MFCHKCGTKLDDNATSCYTCGASQQSKEKVNTTDNSDRTYGIFSGSVPNASPTPQWNNSQVASFKKNNKGLLIGLVAGGVVLLLIVIIVVAFSSGADDNTDLPSGNITSSSTNTTNDNHEQEILECINKSKSYVAEGNFIEALAVLDTAEQLYGSDSRIEEQRNDVNVAKVLNDVSVYEKDKNYVKAIECIENSAEATKNNTDVIQKLNSLRISYKDYALKLAEDTFASSGYKAAIDVLNGALIVLPDDEKINAAIEKYSAYVPISVAKLEYFSGGDFGLDNNKKDNLGNTHDNVVYPVGKAWGNAYVINTYKLDKQYSKLSGVWFQYYDNRTSNMPWSDYKSKLEIYGDDNLLYSGEMGPGIEPIKINLDISNVNELKIDYYAGGQDGPYSGIENFCVQK